MSKKKIMAVEIPVDEIAQADIADDMNEIQTLDREVAIAESIRLLGKQKDIDTLSELDGKQIRALCAIEMIGTEFDVPILNTLSDDFIKFNVSYKRKGRKGIEDILKHNVNSESGLLAQVRAKMSNWTQ